MSAGLLLDEAKYALESASEHVAKALSDPRCWDWDTIGTQDDVELQEALRNLIHHTDIVNSLLVQAKGRAQ